MKNFNPTVPLAELMELGTELSRDQAELLKRIARDYKVTVTRDYLDRPAVSLPDAYKLAEKMRQDAAELQRQVDERQANEVRVAAWQRARNSFWERNWRWPTPHQEEAVVANRQLLAERTVALEEAAGIPHEVAAALHWPSLHSTSDDPDRTYHRPEGI